ETRITSWSGLLDVRGLEALRASRDLELDAVTLGQAAEAAALDGRIVDEHVLSVLLGDEPVPLRVVEPLHYSLRHASYSSLLDWPPLAGRRGRESRFDASHPVGRKPADSLHTCRQAAPAYTK